MLVQDSTYKHYETEYSSYRQERTLVNMHGIFVEVVQQGSLSRLLSSPETNGGGGGGISPPILFNTFEFR